MVIPNNNPYLVALLIHKVSMCHDDTFVKDVEWFEAPIYAWRVYESDDRTSLAPLYSPTTELTSPVFIYDKVLGFWQSPSSRGTDKIELKKALIAHVQKELDSKRAKLDAHFRSHLKL